MESIRYIMNYENCSLKCQHTSPKPLEDEQAIKGSNCFNFLRRFVCSCPFFSNL